MSLQSSGAASDTRCESAPILRMGRRAEQGPLRVPLGGMEITQQVRDYARQKKLDEDNAVEASLAEKAEEFKDKGSEIYVKG